MMMRRPATTLEPIFEGASSFGTERGMHREQLRHRRLGKRALDGVADPAPTERRKNGRNVDALPNQMVDSKSYKAFKLGIPSGDLWSVRCWAGLPPVRTRSPWTPILLESCPATIPLRGAGGLAKGREVRVDLLSRVARFQAARCWSCHRHLRRELRPRRCERDTMRRRRQRTLPPAALWAWLAVWACSDSSPTGPTALA